VRCSVKYSVYQPPAPSTTEVLAAAAASDFPEQLKLCEVEVSEIGLEALSPLMDIIQAQDKDLEAAISAAMNSDVGTM
jgi:hypothetical protein